MYQCICVSLCIFFPHDPGSSHFCSLPGVGRHVSRVSTSDSLGGLDVSVESGEEREQRPEASQGLRTVPQQEKGRKGWDLTGRVQDRDMS